MDASILWYSSMWNNAVMGEEQEGTNNCRIGSDGATWKYMTCAALNIQSFTGKSKTISITLDTNQVIKVYKNRAVRYAISSRYDPAAYANKTGAVTESGQIATDVWDYPHNNTGGALTSTKTIKTDKLTPGTWYLYLWGGAETLAVSAVSASFTLAATYTVTYNANGGSGAPASQTKVEGVTLKLTTSKPSWTGRDFQKWNTAANGSGTDYSSGGNYTANANVTLYAKWSLNTYPVTYNANGGSGAPAGQTKTYGTNLTLSSTTPTRTGYTFVEWATAADGTGTKYNPGATYTANAELTLYAVWTVNKYTLTKNQGAGTNIRVVRTNSPIGHASKVELDNGDDIFHGDVLQPTFTARTGYNLTGKTINGTAYTSGTHTVTGDTTMAATASPKSYNLSIAADHTTVTVDRISGQGGTGRLTDGATIYHDNVLRISAQPASGYRMASLTVNGDPHESGQNITVTGDTAVAATAKMIGNADIYHNGQWKKYRCIIYSGGAWKIAAAKIGGRNAGN